MEIGVLLKNWGIVFSDDTIVSVQRPKTGLLNKTFLLCEGNDLFVLQSVHPAVAFDGSFENYHHITMFLKEHGFQTQTFVKTKTGSLWHEEAGARWRLLRGVKGVTYEFTDNPLLAKEAGSFLGTFTDVLSMYPLPLAKGRESFVYEGELAKLQSYEEQLCNDKDVRVCDAAKLLLSELPQLMLPKDLPQRIIHTDPKISNFLFDTNNSAVCMIDLDALQVLSPLYDLGDAVRSWCGQAEDDPNNSFNKTIYTAFVGGYIDALKTNPLSREEIELIPQAAQLIMLGLATRFLNDYIDDSYFGWDQTRYASRKDHNKARVVGQLSLYNSFIMRTK